MLSQHEAEARVAKGAAYLDRVFPDWPRYIDTGRLDMSQLCRCVLGQLHGDYNDAIEDLFAQPPRTPLALVMVKLGVSRRPGLAASQSLGFDAPNFTTTDGRRRAYRLLQDAWIAVIADRMLSEATQTVDAVAVPLESPQAVPVRVEI